MMSPWFASGTITTSSLTGSSRIGAGLRHRVLEADATPAILKLISDESTEWYLPSKHVTFTSTTGKPSTPPCSIVSCDALLDRGDELARDRAADDLVDELEARRRARAARPAANATPNWPCPPVCFLYLPSASAGAGDRLAVRDLARPRSRPRRRTCGASARARSTRWVSPMPHSSVWWVSALRSRRSAGSSSRRRCSALASLSSSPFDLAWIATGEHRLGRRERLDVDRRRPGRRARRRSSCR